MTVTDLDQIKINSEENGFRIVFGRTSTADPSRGVDLHRAAQRNTQEHGRT
jgi:hypothetical protein